MGGNEQVSTFETSIRVFGGLLSAYDLTKDKVRCLVYVLSALFRLCLVCLALPCLVLSCLVLSCLVLSCLVLSDQRQGSLSCLCLVYVYVLSYLVFFRLV